MQKEEEKQQENNICMKVLPGCVNHNPKNPENNFMYHFPIPNSFRCL